MAITTLSNPKATPGRRVVYRHPVVDTDLPGIIASIDEGNLLRLRLDGHRRTVTVTDSSEHVTYLEETGQLPPAVPVGRFHPIPEELTAVRAGVPLTVVDGNNLLLLTADRDAAVSAVTAFLPDMGYDPNGIDWTLLEARWAVFEWSEDLSSYAWALTWGVEGDDQAVHVHYLPEPPPAPVA
jgi:hypothetical protein